MREKVIAVFDAGKTNKKLFLFNEHYKIVYEKSARFNEVTDEDGDACENLESLCSSVYDSLRELFRNKEFEIQAVNFSTYGASFVYIDEQGEPLTPLYNYLKEYPEELKRLFYDTYGGAESFSMETASPALGNLNSGLQLYRLKHQQPAVFNKLKFALHLPQYLSYLLTGKPTSDMTSIGCHTALWDFTSQDYHAWVEKEGIKDKLAPIVTGDTVIDATFEGNNIKVGTGLHDSSAALIPYLISFTEPFVLLSTGTWSITLNPFNNTPLTLDELKNDCLNYIQYKGSPVKASRLFAGYAYEQQLKRIAAHFNQNIVKYRHIEFDADVMTRLNNKIQHDPGSMDTVQAIAFNDRDLSVFTDDTEAYHQLMADIIAQQKVSTSLVLKGTNVKRIFVDGGFSKNPVFMHLLAAAFPGMEVFAASMAQATAIGTALAIHSHWNSRPLPHDLIELKYYSVSTARL